MLKRLVAGLLGVGRSTPAGSGRAPREFSSRRFAEAVEARRRGDLAGAEALLRELTSEHPGEAGPHALLGWVLEEAGRDAEAAVAYRRTVDIDPGQRDVSFKLAALLGKLGDLEGARQEYQALVTQFPDWLPAVINYGVLSLEHADSETALTLLSRAVTLAPDMPEARVNLATVLMDVGRLDEALEHCDAALSLAPRYVPALKNLAAICQGLGDADRRRSALRARIALSPSDGASIAVGLTLPSVLESAEEILRVRGQLAADMERLAGERLVVRDPAREIGVTTFYLAYHGRDDRQLHEQVAALHLRACPQLSYVAPHCATPERRRAGPIRVGVLSRYLFNHSIGNVTEGLVATLDRRHFSVLALSFQRPFDRLSKKIEHHADEWITLPRNLEVAREAIARKELDVLLYPDVGMDPLAYFLTFARLAPLQCTTWGHPVTTGVPTMDCFLSTDYFEPEDGATHYSERLVCLHDVAFPGYFRPIEPPAPASRELIGFDRGRRVYFCAQALFKFHPEFDAILGEILRRDPGGEIVITVEPARDAYRMGRLQARLQRNIPDVVDRIVFLPRAPSREVYLQRVQACDVALDTIHYCGGNTSLEAIAVGAPVVTLPSALNRGRHTYGFFRKMRFMETVATSPQEYVDLAVRIATDDEFRRYIRAEQKERVNGLYEDRQAVTQIEQVILSEFERVSSR